MLILLNTKKKVLIVEYLIVDFLTIKELVQYCNINLDSKEYYKIYLKKKMFNTISFNISIVLKCYNYDLFYIKISKLNYLLSEINDIEYNLKFNIIVNNLINILLNYIGSRLPTICIDGKYGYYNINYLFLLIYYGATIDIKSLNNHFGIKVYKKYYNLISENMEHNIKTTTNKILSVNNDITLKLIDKYFY